jgi:hypothetical protein
VTHIGPVAQDFYEAFGLGTSDTTIGHMDVSASAFAQFKRSRRARASRTMRSSARTRS